MLFTCEDDGGNTSQVEAETAQDVALEFAEEVTDVGVEDNPDTLSVLVTHPDGKTETVFVEISKNLEFKVL